MLITYRYKQQSVIYIRVKRREKIRPLSPNVRSPDCRGDPNREKEREREAKGEMERARVPIKVSAQVSPRGVNSTSQLKFLFEP